MTVLDKIGAGLLGGAAVLIVVELIVMAVWTSRLARHGRALKALVDEEGALTRADVERLRLGLEETARLWQPYRLALRRLRHPLVSALIGSYWRRRSAP
jgi:hypothetical protein